MGRLATLFLISICIHCSKQLHASELHSRQKRVVNGSVIREGTWPFLVSLKNRQMRRMWEHEEPSYMDWSDIGDDAHICGAALISDQWLVSAKHCIQCKKTTVTEGWIAVAGLHSLVQRSVHEQRIEVDKVLFKEDDEEADNRDIVFMHLKRPIRKTDFVQPICVKKNSLEPKNLECYGMGWGTAISIMENRVSVLPKQFQTRYVTESDPQCFSTSSTNSYVCFGPITGLACRGDSGGPLVCRNKREEGWGNGGWELVGVLSMGTGCNEADDRIIYANVTNFLYFLETSLRQQVTCGSSLIPPHSIPGNLSRTSSSTDTTTTATPTTATPTTATPTAATPTAATPATVNIGTTTRSTTTGIRPQIVLNLSFTLISLFLI